MTEIYLHFLFAHYGLYGNAPVVPVVRGTLWLLAHHWTMQNVEFVNSPLVINATKPPKKASSTEEAQKQEEKEERGWFSFGSSEEKTSASPSPRQRQQPGGSTQGQHQGPRDTGVRAKAALMMIAKRGGGPLTY